MDEDGENDDGESEDEGTDDEPAVGHAVFVSTVFSRI